MQVPAASCSSLSEALQSKPPSFRDSNASLLSDIIIEKYPVSFNRLPVESDKPPVSLSFSATIALCTEKRQASEEACRSWCEGRDLNSHGKTTRPSNVRVCRFRHPRTLTW